MRVGLFRKFIFLLIVSGLSAAYGQGKKGAMGPAPRAVMPHPRPVERLSEMTPEEREKALENLPPERREKLQRQLDRYSKLPAKERERIQRQYDAFRQLTPEQQDTVRKAYRHFNGFPDERKVAVRQEMQRLRKMTDDERTARLNSEDFRTHYGPAEQRVIQDLVAVMPEVR